MAEFSPIRRSLYFIYDLEIIKCRPNRVVRFGIPPMYETIGIRLWYLCCVIPARIDRVDRFRNSALMNNGACVKFCGDNWISKACKGFCQLVLGVIGLSPGPLRNYVTAYCPLDFRRISPIPGTAVIVLGIGTGILSKIVANPRSAKVAAYCNRLGRSYEAERYKHKNYQQGELHSLDTDLN